MAEEKKKVGRPKKKSNKSPSVVNEQKKEIRMSQDINSSDADNEDRQFVTVDMLHDKWANIFKTYGANLNFSDFSRTWTESGIYSYNPFLENQRIKKSMSPATKTSKEELQKAIANPMNCENILRKTSLNLYLTNYMYNILVDLNRKIPSFKSYATPQFLNASSKKEDIVKEGEQVDRILAAFNPKLTLKTIAAQVNIEGKSSYLVRESHSKDTVDFFSMQKLDAEEVKLTGFGSKQHFITSFNMMIFLQPSYHIEDYPIYIQDIWYDMTQTGIIEKNKKGENIFNIKAKIPANVDFEINNNTYMYWVELPQDLCYTFYTDGATPIAAPDAIGLFSDLNDLGDYKWLQASLLSKGVNSILTGEVPFDKSAKGGTDATIISPDVVLGYQKFFTNSVSGNIFPFFAPFTNFELHNIENQPEAMDIIYNRTRDLIATSGNASLMPITDKPSIASTKAAELLQASKCDYLTSQFEECLNHVINENFELKNKWKIHIWGDVFYLRDDIKIMNELIGSGNYNSLIPRILSAFDISVNDHSSTERYLKYLGIGIKSLEQINDEKLKSDSLDKKTQDTISNGKVGRDEISEDNIENDNTAISRDQGNNVSDIK